MFSIYVIEFNDRTAYIGLSINPNRRYLEHLRITTDPVYQHILLTGEKPYLVILEEGLDRHEAATQEKYCLKVYEDLGYHILNKRDGGGLGRNHGKWTKKQCIHIAQLFKTKTEFRKGYLSVYITAFNNGWLEECCQHMYALKKPNGYWDIYALVLEAKKHPDKVSFRTNKSAYTLACKMEILSKLFPKKKPE